MPDFIRYIYLGARAALERPLLMVLYALIDLVSMAATIVPVIIAAAILYEAIIPWILPAIIFSDYSLLLIPAIEKIKAPSFLLPVAGLALSGALLAGTARIFFLAGAIGSYSDAIREKDCGDFLKNAANRLPQGIISVFLIACLGMLWGGWTFGILVSGTYLFSNAMNEPGITGIFESAAFAFAILVFMVFAFGFEVISRLILVRVFSLKDRPLAAIWQTFLMVLKKTGSLILISGLFIFAQVLIVVIISSATFPISFLSIEALGSGWTLAARFTAEIIRTFALGILTLIAYGAFTALALDFEGLLPVPEKKSDSDEIIQTKVQDVAVSENPDQQVVIAVPVVMARPVTQE